MDIATARLLVSALVLFNDAPRFGPRNRRVRVDSYSVAANITAALRAAGWDPVDPELQPPTD